ncbi:uncharacterized protein SPPG_00001, partial [Spizellomyces punctatus DAOM BR117]
MGLGYYFGRLLGKAVGTMHNTDWFRVRRIVDPHFQLGVVKNLLGRMDDDFGTWFAKLEKHSGITRRSASEEPIWFEIDGLKVAERTPFKVVARALFDPVMTEEDFEKMYKMNEIHEKLVETAFLHQIPSYHWYRFLPTAANKRMDRYQELWKAVVLDIISRAQKQNKPCPISEMYKSVESGDMELLELLQTADEILYTNIDVTSTSLTWGLIHLAQNPEAQEKARKELFEALNNPQYGATEKERTAKYIEKQNTFLHFCVLEATRLVPLLFYSLPEVTAEEKLICGYRIPANTSVLIDANTLNRTAPIWQPDGDSYRPERFASISPTEYRYAFWRFGIGPRKCVGQFFGDKIAKMFLFHALRRFEFEIVGTVTKKKDLFVQTPECTFRVRPLKDD